MYDQIWTRLALAASSAETSRAVSMEGANSIAVDMTAFTVVSNGTMIVSLQLSNDAENWSTPVAVGTINAVNSYLFTGGSLSSIAAQFVRLRGSVNVAGAMVVAGGINTAQL